MQVWGSLQFALLTFTHPVAITGALMCTMMTYISCCDERRRSLRLRTLPFRAGKAFQNKLLFREKDHCRPQKVLWNLASASIAPRFDESGLDLKTPEMSKDWGTSSQAGCSVGCRRVRHSCRPRFSSAPGARTCSEVLGLIQLYTDTYILYDTRSYIRVM